VRRESRTPVGQNGLQRLVGSIAGVHLALERVLLAAHEFVLDFVPGRHARLHAQPQRDALQQLHRQHLAEVFVYQEEQWVARQIAEFEAFDLGMQAVEEAIVKLYEVTKSPEAKAMDDIVKKFNTAIGLLDAALKYWPSWMAANFDNRASFGTI
jgi:hypothetical protein